MKLTTSSPGPLKAAIESTKTSANTYSFCRVELNQKLGKKTL